MEKLDKVIRALNCCLSDAECDFGCPYWAEGEAGEDSACELMKKDALTLLKELNGKYRAAIEMAAIATEKNAVAVEVEPVVHAHWICDCEPYHICSNCRHKFSLFDRVPRCPNCGAHMDEEVAE